MKKTPETIKRKWIQKIQEMNIKKNQETQKKIIQARDKTTEEFQRLAIKIQRKADAYKKKKELEYKRKCTAEIRELQGKPPKQYKPKLLTRQQKLKFALEISQENSKLRDTTKDGHGRCISCNKRKSWSELAGGHKHSRGYESVCLWKENINAQCHDCNYATGPEGNVQKKDRINMVYDKNIRKKYGDDIVNEMDEMVKKEISNPNKYTVSTNYLDDYIPELIEENERLRKTKNFYKPKQNRKKVYEKYFLPFKKD